jgi:hypothetical protein
VILPDIYGTYIAQNHQVMFEENLLVVIYDFFCSVYLSVSVGTIDLTAALNQRKEET